MKVMTRRFLGLWAAAAVALAAGCGEAPAPQFRLNRLQLTSNEIHAGYGEEIASVLEALFGTPDNPQVLPEMGLDQRKLNLAAGPAWTGPDDVTHGLYRRHCVHCHGISGDGRGPTARFLDPYPRDYRKGVFKFKSTYPSEKPTDEDLHRVLTQGIPGTSMPSFSLLPGPEVEALVEYVKYLAIRGEMEMRLVSFVADELGEEEAEDDEGNPIMEDGKPKMVRPPLDPAHDPDQMAAIREELALLVESWQLAGEQVIFPDEEQIPDAEPTAESIAEGRELFFGKANCVKCHGMTALGDGEQTVYDVWMQDLEDFEKETAQLLASIERRESLDDPDEKDEDREKRLAGIERDREILDQREEVYATMYAKRFAIPRNLRQGVYRGGRRRLDVFYRIHAGIPGTPMSGVGAATPGADSTLTEEEMWHIVDYVLSLPYEPISGPEAPLEPNPKEVTP
jgi:mono/diheme cytochrome c family protein